MSSLVKKFLNYTKKYKELHLPFLYKKWGVPPEKFTDIICRVWNTFENPRMVDNLLVLDAEDPVPYYEICNGYNRGRFINKRNLWKYCKVNKKENQHISVFSHGQDWVDNFKDKGSVSCSNTKLGMDYLYLELDRETLRKAVEDSFKFYQEFPYKEYIELWYSGNNSIHIVVDASLFGKPVGDQWNMSGRGKLAYNLAHELIGDVRHGNGVVDPWLMKGSEVKELWEELYDEKADHKSVHDMKQWLENTDPNLYTTNSLIRQPYSKHEKGKKFKKQLPIEELIFGIDPEKEFDIDRKVSYITNVRKPYLLHLFYECNQVKKQESHYIPDVDEDEILKAFSQAFKYFDPRDADHEGWVNQLFNPFYEDSNPSVSVNIETGYVQDFGSPEHCYNFKQFKERLNEKG